MVSSDVMIRVWNTRHLNDSKLVTRDWRMVTMYSGTTSSRIAVILFMKVLIQKLILIKQTLSNSLLYSISIHWNYASPSRLTPAVPYLVWHGLKRPMDGTITRAIIHLSFVAVPDWECAFISLCLGCLGLTGVLGSID